MNESSEPESQKDSKAMELQQGAIVNPNQNTVPERAKIFESNEPGLILFHDSQNNTEIQGAVLEKLIAYLTSPHSNTLTYLFTFVLTYPAFTSSEEIMDLLILRFNTPTPEGLDYHIFRTDQLVRIRLRTLNFLKHWIKLDASEFKEGSISRKKCEEFLNQVSEIQSLQPGFIFLLLFFPKKKKTKKSYYQLQFPIKGANEIRNRLKQLNNPYLDNPILPRKKKIPVPYLPKSIPVGTVYTLNDFHPEEVARQLTLIEWRIFYSIHPKECLNKKIFNKEELAPNIHKMVER